MVRFTSSKGGEASLLLRDETIGSALIRSGELQMLTFGRWRRRMIDGDQGKGSVEKAA